MGLLKSHPNICKSRSSTEPGLKITAFKSGGVGLRLESMGIQGIQ